MKELLANIFGLHLGCEIKSKRGQGILTADNLQPVLNDINSGYVWKLILKPLSSITEEDKRELYGMVGMTRDGSRAVGVEYDKDGDRCYLIKKNMSNHKTSVLLKSIHKLFLRSRGYDIPDGLVPDEYKEIRE